MTTSENTNSEREGLSVREAAEYAGVSMRTMQTLVAGGVVPSLLIGRRRIIRKTSLIHWMEKAERRAGR